MANRANVPKVNAGSMADIAFLLLIFFLVTTSIETDVGMERLLPKTENEPVIADVYERNILRILIDDHGNLLVEDEPSELGDLRQTAISFIDNGGMKIGEEGYCSYCEGDREASSSDNPNKAIISVSTQRQTEYGQYIAVQNELVAAYSELRSREGIKRFKQDYKALESIYADENVPLIEKEAAKEKIKILRSMYPMKISELQTKDK